MLKPLLGCTLALGLVGCASQPYESAVGMLSGKLNVEWIGENSFIYRPVPADPLTFVTSDGRKIEPGLMFTDGGSIPPILWSLPGFSPWGYGPAYIVHDWLFTQHHCHYPGWEQISFDQSATVLGEVIETLMVRKLVPPDEEARALIESAVRTNIAKNLWDNGTCTQPKSLVARAIRASPVIMHLNYSGR